MGKGKGSFDHWASRIAVSKVIFELKGDIHEQVARDAFRLAGNKMPGKFLQSVLSCCCTMLTFP
jgi:ribosomal protein L16/L10AE